MLPDQELENTEFEVLRVGEFNDPRYGVFQITEERLQTLKANFDANVLDIDVALDVNHQPEKGAFAWLKSLEVRNGKLIARFKDFTEEGKRLFKEKIYKYFSVEFAPFTTVMDGKKVTIKDVLKGIALTNRPVIKGMKPTFLSEGVEEPIIHYSDMMSIKVFAEHVLQRGAKREDLDSISLMMATLSEDEREEVKEVVDRVEAEVQKAEAESPKEEPKEGEEEKGEEDKKPEEGEEKPAEGDAVAAAELAEKDKKLAEVEAKLAEYEKKDRETKLSERVSTVTLSEGNLTGFTKAEVELVTAFSESLTDEQFAQFSELVKKVRTIDESMLSELGHGKEVIKASEGEDDEDSMLAEAAKLAQKYESDGMAKHLAVEKAQKEVFNKKKSN